MLWHASGSNRTTCGSYCSPSAVWLPEFKQVTGLAGSSLTHRTILLTGTLVFTEFNPLPLLRMFSGVRG